VLYEDLTDFPSDHLFHNDFDAFMNQVLTEKVRDPEEWNLQFEALDDMRRINKLHPSRIVGIVS